MARLGMLRRSRRLLLIVVLCHAFAWFGCRGTPPNFIVIVVDALRADRFGLPGCDGKAPFNVEELSRRTICFKSAYAASSWTMPSVASLFVSQYSSEHKVVLASSILSEEMQTLAEALGGAGYQSGGWTANPLIDQDRGYSQGFGVYEFVPGFDFVRGTLNMQQMHWAPASEINSRAVEWLRARDAKGEMAPFFIYLHYMEAHAPYPCPPEAGVGCRDLSRAINRRLRGEEWDFSGEELRTISLLYDAGVKSAENAIAGLMEEMARGGWLENTWVVVTADHGEMLGEHDGFTHGRTLYEPVIHVPLVWIGPGEGGHVASQLVSLIDVAPTILDLAGIAKPDSFRGQSLAYMLSHPRKGHRPVVAELFKLNPRGARDWRHRLAVVDGTTKMLVTRDDEILRLDLKRDREEEHPVAASRAELMEHLGDAGRFVNLRLQPGSEAREMTRQRREQLRALGYIQ
jgi:arylsulfatase A-like enzyme